MFAGPHHCGEAGRSTAQHEDLGEYAAPQAEENRRGNAAGALH